jgi:hypothetical protein
LFSILLFRFLPFVKKGIGVQVPSLNNFLEPVFRVSLEDITGSPGNRVRYKVDGATFDIQNTKKILKTNNRINLMLFAGNHTRQYG